MKVNMTGWVLSLVEPIVGRILTALGISMVTVTGLDFVLDYLKAQLVSSINSLPADMLGLFLLSGMGQALGIVTGAITTRLMLMQAQSSLKFISSNPQ